MFEWFQRGHHSGTHFAMRRYSLSKCCCLITVFFSIWVPTKCYSLTFNQQVQEQISSPDIKKDKLSWGKLPLWEPTSQGSPHLLTQIQAVPSYLLCTLSYFLFIFYLPWGTLPDFSCFIPGFLAIFTLLSSQQEKGFLKKRSGSCWSACLMYILIRHWLKLWSIQTVNAGNASNYEHTLYLFWETVP